MSCKNIMIFNGSPRKKGTSYSFANAIKKLAEEMNCNADIYHIIDYSDEKLELESLRDLLNKSDIILLAAPMYFDTFPYPVIWFFEKLIAEFYTELQGKSFFAVCQNGFPDITLFEPMLGSCKCFAEAAHMKWLGGLAYSGGAIINGTPVEELGGRGKKITAGFRLALEDVLQNNKISSNAQDMITIKIPKLLYYPLAVFLNHRAKAAARNSGSKNLYAKVYLD
ncbi:MAG: NAD(P)H-dependent oxidoreductase [Bacillota bacterium]